MLDQAVLVLGTGSLQLERNALSSVAKLAALLALTGLGETGGMSIFLAWTAGNAVSLPLVAWRTRGGRALQDSRRLFDLSGMRGLWRSAASHHALNMTIQAPLQILPLLVLTRISAEANGYFNTAILLAAAVFSLPYALTIGLFAASAGDERALLDRMRITLPLSLVVTAGGFLALVPLGSTVLGLFGRQYAEQAYGTLLLVVLAGLPFVVRDHFVALRRVQGRTTGATVVVGAFTAVEMAAAATGAASAGTTGLCVAWVAVLSVEAVVLSVPLHRAWIRARRSAAAEADYARRVTARAAAPSVVAPGAEGSRRQRGSGSERCPIRTLNGHVSHAA